ncbi:MAG: methylmalonyl-CoA mutase, partial [Deltaproteobacteria bacterium]
WQERNASQFAKIDPIVDSMGVEHDILYGPTDSDAADRYEERLGFPGEYPFTRGVYPGMYRRAPWRINQYAGFGSAEDTNARWRFLFERGQMVFNLALDLPTQLGLDSDDPRATPEVGRAGVAIDTCDDLERLLEGLPMVPIYFNIAGAAPILMAMLVAVGERKGVSPQNVMGAFTNDILTTFVCRGTWIFPPEPHLKLVTDMVEYSSRHMSPHFYPLNVQGVYFRSVGASIAQELALVLADALTYVDWALERGMAIDDFARRLSFFLACGPEIFAEAAKFRAARRLWARLMRDRYGAKERESMRLKATAATGGRYFQAIEPLNNLMRGAYGILGAVLGGAQATFIAGYDEAYAIPNEESALLGLRTLQILQEETDVARTIDPLGGSFYVEALTDRIEEKTLEIMQSIDERGGVVRGIEQGWIRAELDRCLYEQMEKLRDGRIAIVGVNRHRQEAVREEPLRLHRYDPRVQEVQAERLAEVRQVRSSDAVERALSELGRAAERGDNVMPALIEAARARATIGEMTSALEQVYGRYGDPNVQVA